MFSLWWFWITTNMANTQLSLFNLNYPINRFNKAFFIFKSKFFSWHTFLSIKYVYADFYLENREPSDRTMKLSIWGAELSEPTWNRCWGGCESGGPDVRESGVPDVSARCQMWALGGSGDRGVAAVSPGWHPVRGDSCDFGVPAVAPGWLLWPWGASCEPWVTAVTLGQQRWAPTPRAGDPEAGVVGSAGRSLRAVSMGIVGLCSAWSSLLQPAARSSIFLGPVLTALICSKCSKSNHHLHQSKVKETAHSHNIQRLSYPPQTQI